MMKYKFGFIGCGNMGGALCTAVAKKESDAAICVCDGVKEKTDALCARFSNLTATRITPLPTDTGEFGIILIIAGSNPQSASISAMDFPAAIVIKTMSRLFARSFFILSNNPGNDCGLTPRKTYSDSAISSVRETAVCRSGRRTGQYAGNF